MGERGRGAASSTNRKFLTSGDVDDEFLVALVMDLHCFVEVMPKIRTKIVQLGDTQGGEVISDLKNFISIFFAFETAFFVMNFQKNFKKGGGSFPI